MSHRQSMRAFWDRAAREDAEFFVDDRGHRGEAFWAAGAEIVAVFERDLGFTVRGPRIVEIGCGVGRLTRVLAERAERVTALDVSPEMLARAREANPGRDDIEWTLGDGASLATVDDASADGVFSHVVFQHIPDPAVTLGYVAEMGRVLRPGGWAAFQVSNDPSIHRRRLRVPRATRHPAWRGSSVDLAALRRTAESAGLTVAQTAGEGTQFCLVRLARPETPGS
ncbi:MAG: class I SAM-dependent methyltransferase [Solirubrobacteraceae bacterium]